ncbi:putative candidate secreted effector protein [Blumeria hordei DH14]|uniref:Putative candidate secreted effector protein n=1 Tax=Blumeria graminis f. sp. hordei (strain DH14) TaxID=546991 RepID=N1JAT7_BLUG1|nr:putative candidate secreted effector protein [Blumeria hordei DH14]
MRILFGISVAILGFIYQTNCINVPYSDMYLPVATNGFLCRTDFFPIDHLRGAAGNAMESTFFKEYYLKFPRLFEDTHLFNVKSDILLSWPVLPTGNYYHRKSGKIRLIINVRGQIMGMVMINSALPDQKISFEKCNPVRRYLQENDDEEIFVNQNWSVTRPTFGYSCGLKFISRSTVDGLMKIASKRKFLRRPNGRAQLANFEKFMGDEFLGDDLYSFPVHQGSTEKITFGAPGPFRIIFDMKNHEFKGIINIENRNEKCVTLWDLSSTSLSIAYSPSSVLNLEATQESYWHDTCFGHKFKTKTVLLYLEFALKEWKSKLEGRKLNFPYLLENDVKLWPMRTPEVHDKTLNDTFAIGYNIKLATYGIYLVDIRKGAFHEVNLCLKFSGNDILNIQRILGPAALKV